MCDFLLGPWPGGDGIRQEVAGGGGEGRKETGSPRSLPPLSWWQEHFKSSQVEPPARQDPRSCVGENWILNFAYRAEKDRSVHSLPSTFSAAHLSARRPRLNSRTLTNCLRTVPPATVHRTPSFLGAHGCQAPSPAVMWLGVALRPGGEPSWRIDDSLQADYQIKSDLGA